MTEVLNTVVHRPRGVPRGTVIALPGLQESAATLDDPARVWAERGLVVIAVDLRGHGLSPRWTRELLDAHPGDVMVEDVLRLVDRFDREDAPHPHVYFGHSAGGSVAAAVAARRSKDTAGVFLEDPFWRLPVTPFQDRQVAADATAELVRLQAMTDAERQAMQTERAPEWAASELPAWSAAKERMDVRLVEQGDVIPTRPWPDLLAGLRAAGVPVSIVTGTDRIGITEAHRALARSFGAATHVVAGASHFIRRDATADFMSLANAFIDSVVNGAVVNGAVADGAVVSDVRRPV